MCVCEREREGESVYESVRDAFFHGFSVFVFLPSILFFVVFVYDDALRQHYNPPIRPQTEAEIEQFVRDVSAGKIEASALLPSCCLALSLSHSLTLSL